MARELAFVALIAGLWICALPAAVVAHSLDELEETLLEREAYLEVVYRPAPGFTLRTAAGEAVSLTDFRGQVVVLNFIYTSCPDVCPLHSEAIAAIQERVNATPMRDVVRFVSITTDPAQDTPEVLGAYGPVHGLDPVNWVFLTSGSELPEATTRELAARYGLKFTPAGDGYQMHGLVTHLIDKSGVLRARYHGLNFNRINVIVHINALVNDFH